MGRSDKEPLDGLSEEDGVKRNVSFKERGRELRSQDAHTFPDAVWCWGLVAFTGEGSGKLYPLGKLCFTWDRETTFEKKLRISLGSVGLVD